MPETLHVDLVDHVQLGGGHQARRLLARRGRELFAGYTHGTDGQTVAVACMLEPKSQSDKARPLTIVKLRNVVENLPDGLSPGTLTGEPVMGDRRLSACQTGWNPARHLVHTIARTNHHHIFSEITMDTGTTWPWFN